ncbi:hypothetical protein IAT40_005781 [Kwoniella sp. CBS 6097]
MPPTLASTTAAQRQGRGRPLRQNGPSFSPITLILVVLLPIYLFTRSYLPLSSASPVSSDRYTLGDLTQIAKDERETGNHKPLQALVVTAHPDDEVMFFSPTILGLISQGWEVNGLCLSTGNSSGLGDIRTQELVASYKALGVSPGNVVMIEARELEDSMTAQWDPNLVAASIGEHGGLFDYLSQYRVNLIITFDDKGITNHPNHIALSRAIPYLTNPPRVLQLRSPSTLPKFTGPLYPIYLHLQNELSGLLAHLSSSASTTLQHEDYGKQSFDAAADSSDEPTYIVISGPAQWLQSVQAMMYHKSQLVWFRWLYLAFSRLMWVNELVEVRS